MPSPTRHAHLLSVGRGEAGVALPGVLFLLIGMMAVLSVGAVAAIATQQGTGRDASSKKALSVAESAASTALLRYGRAGQISESNPCVTGDGGVAPANADGWCDPVQSGGGSESSKYWVRPVVGAEATALEIVSVGDVGSTSRRIRLRAEASIGESGTYFLGDEAIVGIDSLTLGGGGVYVNGAAGSNGPVEVSGGTWVCDQLRWGPGTDPPVGVEHAPWMDPEQGQFSNGQGGGVGCNGTLGGVTSEGTSVHPMIEPPEDIETANSNWRFHSEDGENLPTWFMNQGGGWDEQTRTLRLFSGVDMTMAGGDPYFMCRLEVVGGATLTMEAAEPVQIFFDSPENCPSLPDSNSGEDGKVQLKVGGGSYILHNGNFPGFFMVGSENTASVANMNVGSGDQAGFSGVVYGPTTHIQSLNGGLVFEGALVGKSTTLNGGATAESTFEGNTYPIPVPSVPVEFATYQSSKFAECPATTEVSSAEPDIGCP